MYILCPFSRDQIQEKDVACLDKFRVKYEIHAVKESQVVAVCPCARMMNI